MQYITKYEKQLGLIKLNEKIINLIREINKLTNGKIEIKKNILKIKFYDTQIKLFRQKAKKLKNSSEGKEVAEILSYNTFGKSNEECIEGLEQEKKSNEQFEKMLNKALKEVKNNV